MVQGELFFSNAQGGTDGFSLQQADKDQLKLLTTAGWTHSLAPSMGAAELGWAHRGVGFISLQNALQKTE